MINLKNKNILVTGGTGSWGTAFCEYLQKVGNIPNKLVIFSRDWFKQQTLRDRLNNPDYIAWRIGDVRDKERLKRAFCDIDIVIHAAAIKEIVTCETHIKETVMTNVDGTQNVLDACIDCGVERAILISTDKAVAACNAYGMSKAMAEKIFIQGNTYSGGCGTKFSVCRYGNVIGSNGSVAQLYKKLAEEGLQPLPVTDLHMTRFFYKINDAIEFVLTCFDIMQGGETYIPKIPSVSILDLTKAFGRDYHITGIRPGEKLHECMVPAEMAHLTLDCGDYYLIKPTIPFRNDLIYGTWQIRQLPESFSYDSVTNPDFLTVEQIKELI
ncbi:MAG: polysaccharide biosynthesis protein [bacterium]